VARHEDDQSQRRITLTPPVDIFEDSQGVTVWADLPGVTNARLDVKVHDANLYIEAEAVVPTPAELRLQHARSASLASRGRSLLGLTSKHRKSMQN